MRAVTFSDLPSSWWLPAKGARDELPEAASKYNHPGPHVNQAILDGSPRIDVGSKFLEAGVILICHATLLLRLCIPHVQTTERGGTIIAHNASARALNCLPLEARAVRSP